MDAGLVKLFEDLKLNFDKTPCDTQKCKTVIDQIKAPRIKLLKLYLTLCRSNSFSMVT
jgi:hypothetical protein